MRISDWSSDVCSSDLGLISGSLALIADAAHMLTDSIALMFAWAAFRIARRPATWRHSFGLERVQVLAALLNGVSLFAIAGWIVYEAVERDRKSTRLNSSH